MNALESRRARWVHRAVLVAELVPQVLGMGIMLGSPGRLLNGGSDYSPVAFVTEAPGAQRMVLEFYYFVARSS